MPVIAAAPTKMPLKDRLSLKLTGLFLFSFLFAFAGLWIYDIFTSSMEYQTLEMNNSINNSQEEIKIDPKLEKDLAKVLEFDSTPNAENISDPFSDKLGISNKTNSVNSAAGGFSQPSSVITASSNSGAGGGPRSSPQFNGNPGGNTTTQGYPNSNLSANDIDTRASEDTLTRVIRRRESLRSGFNVEPESSVFAIEDLLPVGVVSGGDEREEVMFYSQSLKRTFSFKVGTRFYDGWLTAFRPEGVVFNLNDEYQSVKIKGWERSINSSKNQSVSVLPPRRIILSRSND